MKTKIPKSSPCLRASACLAVALARRRMVQLSSLILMVSTSVVLAENMPTAEARALVQDFMKTLKGELMQGMAEGGPETAIVICSEKAPALSAKIAKEKGWQVGRTSLKPRNPDNTPDEWERKTLESFEQKKNDGADPKTLEAETQIDGEEYRYMKAIPTAALCLTCHGQDITPSLQTKLKTLYPQDQAIGYQEGDLRGAFTLRRALPTP